MTPKHTCTSCLWKLYCVDNTTNFSYRFKILFPPTISSPALDHSCSSLCIPLRQNLRKHICKLLSTSREPFSSSMLSMNLHLHKLEDRILPSGNCCHCLRVEHQVFFTNAFKGYTLLYKWPSSVTLNPYTLLPLPNRHFSYLSGCCALLTVDSYKRNELCLFHSLMLPVLNFFHHISPLFFNLALLKCSGHGQNKAEFFVRI